MGVKTVKVPETPLVTIAEVLAEVSRDGSPDAWRAEAERLAETMRAAVTRDWRSRPCLSWVDAERLYLRLLRDRAQRNAEIEERLVEADAARRAAIPRGVPVDAVPVGVSAGLAMMLNDPMDQGSRRESVLEHALANRDGAVYHPVRDEQADQ